MSTISEQIRMELLMMVRKHDYSHMFSDDHRSWEAGMRSQKEIEAKIHALCGIHREDAEGLYKECLGIRDEQYIDGLTHKTIKGWFSTYIGE